MSQRPPRESLTDILQVEGRPDGSYGARLESFWGGTEPGDWLARATLAATAEDPRPPAAIQASFLAKPQPDVELSFDCQALAPDRKCVRVSGESGPIGEAIVRFAPAGDGLSYQSRMLDPGLPAPEELPSEATVAEAEGWAPYAVGPIESRRIGDQTPVKDDEPAVWLGWLRPRSPLSAGDDRLQSAALAFLSQYRSHWAVERRLGSEFPNSEITPLEHSLWIHRTEPWDDFFLVKTQSEIGVAGRCFSRREIHTRSGALVASAAWEALVRPR